MTARTHTVRVICFHVPEQPDRAVKLSLRKAKSEELPSKLRIDGKSVFSGTVARHSDVIERSHSQHPELIYSPERHLQLAEHHVAKGEYTLSDEHFREAALHGNAKAVHIVCSGRRDLVPADTRFDLLAQTAKAGDETSMLWMTELHENGSLHDINVPKDLAKAHRGYRSLLHANDSAIQRIAQDKCRAYKMQQGDVESILLESQADARLALLEKAARSGDETAEMNLCMLGDAKRASQGYRRLLLAKDPAVREVAQSKVRVEVQRLHESGTATHESNRLLRSILHAQTADDHCDVTDLLRLAKMCEKGEGGPPDRGAALLLFGRAAVAGNQEGIENHARLFYQPEKPMPWMYRLFKTNTATAGS